MVRIPVQDGEETANAFREYAAPLILAGVREEASGLPAIAHRVPAHYQDPGLVWESELLQSRWRSVLTDPVPISTWSVIALQKICILGIAVTSSSNDLIKMFSKEQKNTIRR